MNLETKECSCELHKQSKSKYEKNNVPIALFEENFHKFKYCSDCREYNRNRRKNKLSMDNKLMKSDIKWKTCLCKYHTDISDYPKTNVPIELFRKYLNDPNSLLVKYCIDCKTYDFKLDVKSIKPVKFETISKENLLLLNTESIKLGFLICSNTLHSERGSIHPRKNVPVELFRKYPENPKSILLPDCIDCRKFRRLKSKQRICNKTLALEENKFFCTHCHKEKDNSNKATNKDGTKSIFCIECQKFRKNKKNELRDTWNTFRFDFMQEYECSCYMCKSIYMCDAINNMAIELNTFIKDNCRHVVFNGKEYTTKNFLIEFKDKLEMNILHFDHLTEIEQRERGLLLPHEKYIPKKKIVAKCDSVTSRRLEALKCQLLCARCHVVATIQREKGRNHTGLKLKKFEYANSIKSKGCENCKYINVDLCRFFDFDHLDPKTKINSISQMVIHKSYTYEDFLLEITKCRVLCRHCHMIITKKQMDAGIVNNVKRSLAT